jgi:serine protease Do
MHRLTQASFFALMSLVYLAAVPAQARLPDFADLVEAASPAVVNIEATRTAEAAMQQRGAPDFNEEEVPEFFRRFFGMPGQPGATPLPRDRTSQGSGFLISTDGFVLTNHHVIDGADEIVVRLSDRRELKAELVGSDPQSDVALLKIEGGGFPAARLGDSEKLRPGQWVVAIGSPFGFDRSVTAGIVSATGRSSYDRSQQYVPFIQTDVAINRGNSGGPLLNTDGEVVGINSQIFSNTGGFMGVSFAIPIETAMNAAEQLKSKGRVSRGLLGVNIQEVSRDMAQTLGLPKPGGAAITGFSEDSAGQKAGLEVGDVIVEFDGREIARSAQLPPLVGARPPGAKVKVKVFRDGRTRDFTVTLGELPDESAAAVSAAPRGQAASGTALGLTVEALDAEQRERLGLKRDEGVVVRRVSGMAARRAGLQTGDIVLMVGRKTVGTPEAFRREVEAVGQGQPVMLLVRRGEATQFITVTPRGQE